MKFNLNQFLISISFILDFIEIDILEDITNHGKRVGYIALKIGEKYNLTEEERFSLLAFALMHDLGGVKNEKKVSKTELEKVKSHCIIGEESIQRFPFFREYENVILYHHENYDGSGFFQKSGEEIPLFSQIIAISDHFELIYESHKKRSKLINSIQNQIGSKFSQELFDKFLDITQHESFWLNLKDQYILKAIERESPQFSGDYSYQELHELTAIFSDIIDSKSQFTRDHSSKLSDKAGIMADYYGFNEVKRSKFMIAADLHDLGKLAVPNKILDKPGRLNKYEFRKIKAHSYYTRRALDSIDGFAEITEWAANHHEKNDGTGYPYGLTRAELDFPSQLMVALDIYQALREVRPYRDSLNHEEAVNLLADMAKADKINAEITRDIAEVFS
ncbi:MAG: HD-GYP domain-containing protein [Bacillota bacterium]